MESELSAYGRAEHDSYELRRTLRDVATLLLSADEPNTMLRGLIAKIGPQLSVDVYFNYMVNDDGDALRLASCEGITHEVITTITRLEFGQAICGTAAATRQPIVASHIQESDDPKAQLVKSFGIRAYACNPLITDDVLLGTLSFASRQKDQFDRMSWHSSIPSPTTSPRHTNGCD